ncbi:hypothetical protein V7200_20745 [Cytobacillus firmus]|uniref:Uncharacterized protein n=1 Tax=Cytobacillus firmus TaxID=1399 RepID=A0A800MUJ7_CYTFI|nr:hypothetical protein [Cytobacillus firmus]KAF0822763.1 hypothetical protein KIS1582_3456 [Cytobacillus firmus]MBG9451856.1 hypothetical protein [Cytobacillus firmus]
MDDARNEKEENQLQLRFERNSQVKAYALTSFSVLLASVPALAFTAGVSCETFLPQPLKG